MNENSPQNSPEFGLTREYLANVSGKQVFRPQSLEEAEYIARQLQELGFRYYVAEYANGLRRAVGGSIYLDTDKTIMVADTAPEGTQRSADEFMPLIVEPRRIDASLFAGPVAVFPRSVAEGSAVLRVLAAAGVIPQEQAENSFPDATRAVRQGMVIKDGKAVFAPRAEDLQGAKILSASDLGIGVAGGMTTEQSAIHSAFNEMAARMEQMATRMEQMATRIERLEDAVLPKTLDKKSSLPRPDSGLK